MKTLEDCVEFLVDKKHRETVQLQKSDYTLFYSMARQVKSGIGFTERQKNLMIRKIRENYMDYIENAEQCFSTTRVPIRTVDHVNRISIVDTEKEKINKHGAFSAKKAICVEFSYNKKFINKIKNIASKLQNMRSKYYHPHGSKVHYFTFENAIVYDLVCAFHNTKMQIDDELLAIKNAMDAIHASASEYISSVDSAGNVKISEYDKKFVPDNGVSQLHLVDRHRRYGMNLHSDYQPQSLTESIAYRKEKVLFASNTEIKTEQIVQSIIDLDRFPVLVVLNKTIAHANLRDFHKSILPHVPNTQQSVLFRLEKGNPFNDYVHANSLNNYVDNNTKVVYISSQDFPKILLTADWKPITCVQYTSFAKKHIDSYVEARCDLRIYYEKELSPFKKHKEKYEQLQINNTR